MDLAYLGDIPGVPPPFKQIQNAVSETVFENSRDPYVSHMQRSWAPTASTYISKNPGSSSVVDLLVD
jgi:hypothetical protein